MTKESTITQFNYLKKKYIKGFDDQLLNNFMY